MNATYGALWVIGQGIGQCGFPIHSGGITLPCISQHNSCLLKPYGHPYPRSVSYLPGTSFVKDVDTTFQVINRMMQLLCQKLQKTQNIMKIKPANLRRKYKNLKWDVGFM